MNKTMPTYAGRLNHFMSETVARFCLVSYALAARLRSDFKTYVFTEERASVMEDNVDLNRYLYDCEQYV